MAAIATNGKQQAEFDMAGRKVAAKDVAEVMLNPIKQNLAASGKQFDALGSDHLA